MKIGRILSITLILSAILLSQAYAEEHMDMEQFFSKGNVSYENGEYDKAIVEYERILAGGFEGASVYYNLGGAYFKTGQIGRAILNYERARLMAPRDADLLANYRFARSQINGKIIPKKDFWTWRPIKMYLRNFTISELILMASIMFISILVLICFAAIFPGIKRYQVVGVCLLSLFILFNVVLTWRMTDSIKKCAIVVVPKTEVMFGPFDSATKFFTLHEGMNVAVLQAKGEWYKVRRGDGKVGWIRRATIEKIYSE